MTKRERIPKGPALSVRGLAPGRGRLVVAGRSSVVGGMALMALTIALLLSSGGCGRMGDPIPPSAALLASPGKPVLVGSGQNLILSWSPPYNTAAGVRAPAPRGYLIERSHWSSGQEECDECADKVTVVAELDAEKLRLEGKAAERWTDTGLSPGITYGYRVYPLDQRKRIGNPSQLSKLTWRTIAPPNITATPGDSLAQFSYSPPGETLPGTTARGVAVYDEAQKLVLQLPYSSSGGDGQYTGLVTGLENGKLYRFSCRWAVTTAQGWQLQSAPVYFTVTPNDTTSPEPPRDLVAFGDEESIELNWFAARGERYEVLIVERMVEGAGDDKGTAPWRQLASVDGASLGYKDSSAEPGIRYRYRVIAQDSAGNISAPSSEAVGRRLEKR